MYRLQYKIAFVFAEFLGIMRCSGLKRNAGIKTETHSRRYFYMNYKILRDFQICISVPLMINVQYN